MNDMELSLDLITEYYLEELDNIEMEYTEKVNPLAPIDKLLQIFDTYVTQIKKIRKEKNDIKYLKEAIKKCKYINKNIPELKNKKFIFVHYIETDDLRTNKTAQLHYAKNLATAIIHHDEDGIMDILEEYCIKTSNNSSKYMWKVNLAEASEMIEYCANFLESDLDNDVALLKDVRKMLEKAKRNDTYTEDLFKCAVKKLMKMIKRRSEIVNGNIHDGLFSIKEGLTKKVNMYSKNCVKKIEVDPAEISDEEIMKHSTAVREMCWGRLKYTVYQTDYPNVSAFNCGGLNIFVSKDFFEHSKEMQNVILYHEMGHYYEDHFNEKPYSYDDKEVVERIYELRKEFKKFCKKNSVRCQNTNTCLATLMMELEADRFAVNYMGKRLTKKSLDQTLHGYIDNSDSMDDDRKMNLKLNVDFRKQMIDKLHKDTLIV